MPNLSAHYPPPTLSTLQYWFGTLISRPLTNGDRIQPFTPSGNAIAEEAAKYILPSPTLQPHERIQIYNQQYWWRLISTLQTTFPSVVRLFGYSAFNEQIAIPYLIAHPPTDWSLNTLGSDLASWVQKDYLAPDKSLIFHCASLDWAFNESFLAPHIAPIPLSTFASETELLESCLSLQPAIHIFSWEYDLLSFRSALLEHDVSYWLDHPFPSLLREKNYHFILYRTPTQHVGWYEIEESAYALLKRFQEGGSLEEICHWIEAQPEPIVNEISSHLSEWLQLWAQKGWLIRK